jgi:hypothetical protein
VRLTVTAPRVLALAGLAAIVAVLPQAALFLLPGLCVLPRTGGRRDPTREPTDPVRPEVPTAPEPSRPTSGAGESRQSGPFARLRSAEGGTVTRQASQHSRPSTSTITTASTSRLRGNLLDVVARAHLASVVFWILLFLQLRWIRLPLLQVTTVLLVCSAVVLAVRVLGGSVFITRGHLLFSALALAATLGLRLWPAATQSLPLGHDIAFPALMARLVYEANAHPLTCQPLLPIQSFGVFATGMASLTAQTALVAKQPVWVSIWHVSLTAFVTHWLALYLLLRARFSVPVSWLAAGAGVLLGRIPSVYLVTGQGGTVLSHALVAFAVASLCRGPGAGNFIRAAGAWVGAWAVHPIPALAAAYAGIVAVPAALVLGWRPRPLSVLAAIIACVAFAAPLKDAFSVTRSAYETDYATQWSTRFEGLGEEREAATLFDQLRRFLERGVGFPLLALASLGWFLCFKRSPREGCLVGIVAAACLALSLAPYLGALPLSYMLYPYRTLPLLLLPVSWAVGAVVAVVAQALRFRVSGTHSARAEAAAVAALLALVALALPSQRKNYEPGNTGVGRSLTPGEVDMHLWIANHTSTSDCICADGHGGSWIPAVAYRRVANLRPNPMLRDEISKATPWASVTHLYHHDVPPRRLGKAALSRAPFLELLHQEDDLSFFRVLSGETLLRLIRRYSERDPMAGERKGSPGGPRGTD